jgi:UDP-N-acetylglucosamine--N-acetylmuramyl-(pentapeptide) pyrophosphoryl-undecaprenol N-acetylglucosamine transferase
LPVRLRSAVRAAAAALESSGAQVLLGVGGYVCAPAYLAARRRHIPIVVHEANPLPGVANRLGARLTSHVAITVPGTPLPHAVLTGLPLRPQITHLDRPARRASARAELGLPEHGPVLLVTGGSQGARRINEALSAAAPAFLQAGAGILHVTGPAHAELSPAGPGHVVLAYAEDMAAAYAAADLVLCRAGAVTCAELAAVGLPAVYVPLPVGNGEQARNAAPTVSAGGGLLMTDEQCTSEALIVQVLPLLLDTAQLQRMGVAARRSQPVGAAEAVAGMVERAAGQTSPP